MTKSNSKLLYTSVIYSILSTTLFFLTLRMFQLKVPTSLVFLGYFLSLVVIYYTELRLANKQLVPIRILKRDNSNDKENRRTNR